MFNPTYRKLFRRVTAMQQLLRSEFELADANWQNWTSR
jgi:hypothetical protein